MKKDLVYFLSDIHLGLDLKEETSLQREMRLSEWLLHVVLPSAQRVYFVGDIFDYWFEFSGCQPIQYKYFYDALHQLKVAGVHVHFFTGNHDMWMKDYFTTEFGIPVFSEPQLVTFQDRSFYIAHGDGLGDGDYLYKMLKTVMKNRLSMFLYNLLPQSVGLAFMKWCSHKSREQLHVTSASIETDRLVRFALQHAEENDIDYYIMGHRHLLIDFNIPDSNSRYINLGDWLHYDSYAVFDGTSLVLKSLTDAEILG